MNIAVVGSGKYKPKRIVIEILESKIDKNRDVIVSGHSPRNTKEGDEKGNNVDIWAEEWAFENCKHDPIIHEAKTNDRNGYFARNKLVAQDSDVVFAFINKDQYRSGTWNTIKWFSQKPNFRLEKLKVYDQYGKLWTKLPTWVKEKKNESLLDF